MGVLTLIAHYIELYSLASSVSLNAKIPEGILLLTISSCIHILLIVEEIIEKLKLIAHYIELYSRELTEDESHELESNLIAHYIELYSQQYI